jgi:hypothetical protein
LVLACKLLSQRNLLDTLLAYFKVGLEAREPCVWVIHESLTETAARRAPRQAVPGGDRYLADGSIEIGSSGERYLKGGPIRPRTCTDSARGGFWKQYANQLIGPGAYPSHDAATGCSMRAKGSR